MQLAHNYEVWGAYCFKVGNVGYSAGEPGGMRGYPGWVDMGSQDYKFVIYMSTAIMLHHVQHPRELKRARLGSVGNNLNLIDN